ncbi:MAG: hypothetical protein K2N51_11790 [Lachnospiraceae bacterium]|nr:hypothetical protein [Lachnospiraceae bacterium]
MNKKRNKCRRRLTGKGQTCYTDWCFWIILLKKKSQIKIYDTKEKREAIADCFAMPSISMSIVYYGSLM